MHTISGRKVYYCNFQLFLFEICPLKSWPCRSANLILEFRYVFMRTRSNPCPLALLRKCSLITSCHFRKFKCRISSNYWASPILNDSMACQDSSAFTANPVSIADPAHQPGSREIVDTDSTGYWLPSQPGVPSRWISCRALCLS